MKPSATLLQLHLFLTYLRCLGHFGVKHRGSLERKFLSESGLDDLGVFSNLNDSVVLFYDLMSWKSSAGPGRTLRHPVAPVCALGSPTLGNVPAGFPACSQRLTQLFALAMGWKMWWNDLSSLGVQLALEGCTPGLRDRASQGRAWHQRNFLLIPPSQLSDLYDLKHI